MNVSTMLKVQNANGKEVGCALNAETFLDEARKALHNGNYSDFLCSLDLAGQFARDARGEFYARTRK